MRVRTAGVVANDVGERAVEAVRVADGALHAHLLQLRPLVKRALFLVG